MAAIIKLARSDPAISSMVGKSDFSDPAGCTERVVRLREYVLNSEPSLCIERGLLVTEA